VTQRRSRTTARSQNEFGERALRFLTLASVIIGLPLAIAQGRPASVIVATVILCLGSASALSYLWRKRLPSGNHKYGWERWAATGLTLAIVSTVAMASIFSSGRSFLMYGIFGFQNPSAAIRSGEPTFAQSAKYVRILLPVSNNIARDQELNQISLTIDWTGNILCYGPPTFSFRLSSNLYVDEKTGSVSGGSVVAESGTAAGFSVPVTGNAQGFCNNGELILDFIPPALVLEKSSTTVISIDVPKRIEISYVTHSPTGVGRFDTERGQLKLDMATLLMPSVGDLEDVTIELSAITDSGTTITACREVQGTQPARDQVPGCSGGR
jgi:hypothetical protein